MRAPKSLWFATLLFCSATTTLAAAQRVPLAALDSLRALGLDSVPGVATVFFRPADRARAIRLQQELERGLAFFRQTLSLQSRLRLAVLQPTDWARMTALPYGFPNNIGPPANLILAPVSRTCPERCLDESRADLLLLFHEGGHLLTFELVGPETDPAYHARLDSIPEWYWEFAATAFLTSYLRAERPTDAAVIERYFQILTSVARPRFVHLDAWFQTMMSHTTADGQPYLRSEPGRQNFGWYQGVVGLLGMHVPAAAEPALFRHIRLVGRRSHTPTTREIVQELDAVASGFIVRADSLGVAWR